MTATMHKLMIVCICLAVWLMQSGCATSSRVAPPAADKKKTRVAIPLSADERTSLGTIGVVSAQSRRRFDFKHRRVRKERALRPEERPGAPLAGFGWCVGRLSE